MMKHNSLLKRVSVFFLVLLFIVSALSGCGKGPSTSSDDVSADAGIENNDSSLPDGENSNITDDQSGENSSDISGVVSGSESGGSGSGGSGSGGSKPTSGNPSPSVAAEATAVLGKSKKLNELKITTPNGEDYSFSERAGREAWMISGKNKVVLSVKLSDAIKIDGGE